MKRVLYYGVLGLLAVFAGIPFHGTDVAKLQPIEVIAISKERNLYLVQTDTEDMGRGTTLYEAFADLKASATGQVFLETAQYLLIEKDLIPALSELKTYLRPACNLCLWDGSGDLTEAADFLDAHHPGLTLLGWLAENQQIPILKTDQGRMHLELWKNLSKTVNGLDDPCLFSPASADSRENTVADSFAHGNCRCSSLCCGVL